MTTIAELSPSDDLVSLSPEFVITSPNPDEGADYYWVSVAAVSGNQFVIMEALSGVSGVNGGKVAFGEFKNRPLGVVVGPSSGIPFSLFSFLYSLLSFILFSFLLFFFS